MRKLPVIFVLLLLMSLGLSLRIRYVYSQTPSPAVVEENDEFDEAYTSYLKGVEEYQIVHNEYILRRSQYLNFKTLKSQQDAHDATVKMLQARDNVVIIYLVALKARLQEAIGIAPARSEGLKIRIDEERGWFTEHRNEVSSAGTLDDLVSDSNEAEKHFLSVEPLFYEILSVIAQGRITDFTERTDELTMQVDAKVEQIRSDDRSEYTFSSDKFSVLDRWMFEAENRVTRSKEKQIEADVNILDYSRKRGGSIISNYNSISSTLGEAQLFLKEANTFLKEIIREIKTAE